MMSLQTHATVSADQVDVTWSVGQHRGGVVTVRLSEERRSYSDNDKAIVGELCAVRYLLNDKQVFGLKPVTSAGIRLIVSKGAIKKLAKGQATTKHFIRHSAFLRRQLDGVAITVAKQQNEASRKETPTDHITDVVTRDDIIHSPVMGKVRITQHAVARYAERLSSGVPKNPRASLIQRIKGQHLGVIPMPEAVKRHKAKKYREREGTSELWGHPDSPLRLQVINNGKGLRLVVTVFERSREDLQRA